MEVEHYIDIHFCQKDESFGYKTNIGNANFSGGYLSKTVEEGVLKLHKYIEKSLEIKKIIIKSIPNVPPNEVYTKKALDSTIHPKTLERFRHRLSEEFPSIDFTLEETVNNKT